jgi:hypothetical protein
LRYLYGFVGLFVLLGAASAAGGHLPIHFPVMMDSDTYVDADHAGDSFGDSDVLWATSAGGNPVKVTYLSFINDFVTNSVSNPDQIDAAKLSLNVAKVEKPGKIAAYFVEGPTTNEATWDSKSNYDTGVSSSTDVQAEGEYSLDVTPIIKEALKSCPGECGYTIALVAEGDASVGFASSEACKNKTPEECSNLKPILEYTLTG